MAAMDHVDHVGSLVRPPAIQDAWRKWQEGDLSQDELTAITDDEVRDVVKFQEELGLQWVTDGEYRRGAWAQGFTAAVSGFERFESELQFQDGEGNSNPAPLLICAAPPKRERPIVADDFEFLKSAIIQATPKVTMPTPALQHLGHFDKSFEGVFGSRDAYFDALSAIYQEEVADLAAVGCTFIQLDEVAIPTFCDPKVQAVAKGQGLDVEQVFDAYTDSFNNAVSNAPAGMTIAMHMCRGNQAGRWIGNGGYDAAADRIFNKAAATHYLMEYDTLRAGDFEPLRFMPRGKIAFLGIVSTKRSEVESKDYLIGKIEEAAQFSPIEQLGITTQCGFGTSGTGVLTDRSNPMTIEVQKAKLERMIEVAEEVWG